MYSCCILLGFLIQFFIYISHADEVPLRQERAHIKYYNPKYIKDGEVFTGRRTRHEPYLTNMTGAILFPFNNNVSCGAELTLANGNEFKVIYRVCDAYKLKWVVDYISAVSDVPIKCPVPAATYHFFNMELPPKQFPLVIRSDSNFDIVCLLTDTHEKLFTVTVALRNSPGRNKKRIG